MRRKSLLYFSFLGAALLLFGLAGLLTLHLDGDFGELALLRFVVLCLAIGSAGGTWATAVTISSIHKKTGPLFVTVALVVVAGVAFATACYRMPPARV